MNKRLAGFHGVVLEVDLSSGQSRRVEVPAEDYRRFVGGRGLGIKLLWDRLPSPGVNALAPENPLIFMTGPFCGLPAPSASRTCIVTKSPHTSPMTARLPHGSTLTYSNVGGFLGPEIRFAGYDGIVVIGKAARPVILVIDDGKVEIRDAEALWGLGGEAVDQALSKELGSNRYQTLYIGPAGEKQVEYACLMHTVGRAAGRGGAGAVMGSKNLKALAIRGTGQPGISDHQGFLKLLKNMRIELNTAPATGRWRKFGTAMFMGYASGRGAMAVKNYQLGTFQEVDAIGSAASLRKVWVRNDACFCCPLACKKNGRVAAGPNAGVVFDGPEYETGTMLGPNLMIGDLAGILKSIRSADDLGLDIISSGNTLGFLMECRSKGLISREWLDGVDLAWGNAGAARSAMAKIARREGFGDLAAGGLKALAAEIGQGSHGFAMQVKGNELAAWNVHVDPGMGLSYATSNRGACHVNGRDAQAQNQIAIMDSLGICAFASGVPPFSGYGQEKLVEFLNAITGLDWDQDSFDRTGERIYNLERAFNCREGFRRADDSLPRRFFSEPLPSGPGKGAKLKQSDFDKALSNYYTERGWDVSTGEPTHAKLNALGLGFALNNKIPGRASNERW